MRQKIVQCPRCRGDIFKLHIFVYEKKRNEMHLKCQGCDSIVKLQIGDTK